MIRRQASLYVPAPYRAEIDALRKQHDPVQHALIPAHVTLCRDSDVVSWDRFEHALKFSGAAPITLTFSKPVRLDDGCLMLPCSHGRDQFRALRGALLREQNDDIFDADPHITLVHPRNAARSTARPADIVLDSVGKPITFATVNVIELRPPKAWQVLHTIHLN